jgi:hypothetical protein
MRERLDVGGQSRVVKRTGDRYDKGVVGEENIGRLDCVSNSERVIG